MTDTDALRAALERIAATNYGLQGIVEDYSDANAFNYHAMKYWRDLAQSYQAIARAALAAAPQPAPGRDDNFQLSGTKVESPAQPPTSVDRDALVEVIRDAILDGMGSDMGVDPSAERAADALPARGLRLAGNETMAWVVVGRTGNLTHILRHERWQAESCKREGERVVPVAIRVVEGGDDAA